MDPQRQPGVQIDQVFLIDAHFGHRPDFLALPAQTDIGSLNLNVEVKTFGQPKGNRASVFVRVATEPDDKDAVYQFSIRLGAFVSAVQGEENLPPADYVTQAGATFLYPFVREAIANLTARGRFGPVYIKPINLRAVIAENSKAVRPALPKGKLGKRGRRRAGPR
jgi:preprotein translocase subunit SecB